MKGHAPSSRLPRFPRARARSLLPLPAGDPATPAPALRIPGIAWSESGRALRQVLLLSPHLAPRRGRAAHRAPLCSGHLVPAPGTPAEGPIPSQL